MKWPRAVSLLALAAGCRFPSYLIEATAEDTGGGGTGGATAGAGAMGGAMAGEGMGGTSSAGNAAAAAGTAGTAGSAGSAGSAGASTELAPFGVAGKWQLTLQDEFEGDTLDASRWITYMVDGDSVFREWGGRQEWIADENVRVADGDCVLTAKNESSNNHPFTSGAINSAGLFEQEFGFFEARIKLPLGRGFWGVWALRSLEGWPPAINGVEVLGGQPARATFSYWYEAEAGATNVRHEGTDDYTNSYHIYGIDWQPSHVAFYVDGALIESLDDPEERVRDPLYPGVNLSISSGDSGDPVPDETTPWPGELRIDWIRVYQKLD